MASHAGTREPPVFRRQIIFSSTKVEELAEEIARKERLITSETRDELLAVLTKIQNTVFSLSRKLFYKHIVLETHLLPLTNIAVDVNGET